MLKLQVANTMRIANCQTAIPMLYSSVRGQICTTQTHTRFCRNPLFKDGLSYYSLGILKPAQGPYPRAQPQEK